MYICNIVWIHVAEALNSIRSKKVTHRIIAENIEVLFDLKDHRFDLKDHSEGHSLLYQWS